ncbi:glycosyltransferase [Sporolactobacillus sp. STSJ-5]|uniref:tetratricopeptide repeat-containing glycosyltransferase family 2 protein n=1 Tax=Sporolactobacillus sp. STSJ-5 TaxID=2965076 RepID=UPI002105E727|nr:TPR domain-containing glycosyltransferase [Sporolactobacillus sp. STSJ-5]MCQ2011625.1 glycosyltransferase [Sporolactobacillus sp. STSJ-5]
MSKLISLCMIVKNEESVLQRCLESVKDGVDEIVVVDTGSTDNTKDIAYKYTDKVFNYKWNDSFSEARNFAQSKATGEWILALDADEFVDHLNMLEFRKELKENENKFNMYVVKIYNFAGKDAQTIFNNYHVRVYRNDSVIQYYRAIHEQLKRTDGKELSSSVSKLVVYHSGYLSYTVVTKNKGLRNQTLINKEIEAKGQTGFDYFNLGNEFVSQGMSEKALECYVKAYKKATDIKYSWVGACLIQICQCLVSLNRYKDALNVIRDSEPIFNSYPDFSAMKGRIYILQGRFNDALHELTDIINHQDLYTEALLSTDSISYLPNKWIGQIYQGKNDIEKSIFYYSKAFQENRNDMGLLKGYFGLLFKYSSYEELEDFFAKEQLLKGNEISNLFLLKVIFNFPESSQYTERLVSHTTYINNIDVKAKCRLINGKTAGALELIDQLTIKQKTITFNVGIFDFSDYIIASLASKQESELVSYAKKYKNAEGIINLFVFEQETTEEDLPIYLAILERTICLRQFDLFAKLLKYRTVFDSKICINIGHLLYQYHFFDLAIQFYNEAGTLLFDEPTYLNIIEEFKKQNMLDDAFQLALQALNKGYTHFSIIKNMLETANETKSVEINRVKGELLKLALKLYPDSAEMRELLYLNR